MPLIESLPNMVSNEYAKGLFDSCMAAGGREAAENALGELEEILALTRQMPQFAELLTNPGVSGKDRIASIDRIFKGRVSDSTLRFLQVLNMRGRIAELPAVVASYDAVLQKMLGRVEVDAFTPAKLDDATKHALAAKLGGAIGREVVLHNYIDPAMIGGLKIRIGDQLLDGSVSTQLRNMQDKLTVGGMANARAAMDRILSS
jgi:F-type H+-transporting ATPase subunit delta